MTRSLPPHERLVRIHLRRKPADYVPDPTIVARAALARGPLVKDRNLFRFGERRFAPKTVARLVDGGDAVRLPDGSIVAATPGEPR